MLERLLQLFNKVQLVTWECPLHSEKSPSSSTKISTSAPAGLVKTCSVASVAVGKIPWKLCGLWGIMGNNITRPRSCRNSQANQSTWPALGKCSLCTLHNKDLSYLQPCTLFSTMVRWYSYTSSLKEWQRNIFNMNGRQLPNKSFKFLFLERLPAIWAKKFLCPLDTASDCHLGWLKQKVWVSSYSLPRERQVLPWFPGCCRWGRSASP